MVVQATLLNKDLQNILLLGKVVALAGIGIELLLLRIMKTSLKKKGHFLQCSCMTYLCSSFNADRQMPRISQKREFVNPAR